MSTNANHARHKAYLVSDSDARTQVEDIDGPEDDAFHVSMVDNHNHAHNHIDRTEPTVRQDIRRRFTLSPGLQKTQTAQTTPQTRPLRQRAQQTLKARFDTSPSARPLLLQRARSVSGGSDTQDAEARYYEELARVKAHNSTLEHFLDVFEESLGLPRDALEMMGPYDLYLQQRKLYMKEKLRAVRQGHSARGDPANNTTLDGAEGAPRSVMDVFLEVKKVGPGGHAKALSAWSLDDFKTAMSLKERNRKHTKHRYLESLFTPTKKQPTAKPIAKHTPRYANSSEALRDITQSLSPMAQNTFPSDTPYDTLQIQHQPQCDPQVTALLASKRAPLGCAHIFTTLPTPGARPTRNTPEKTAPPSNTVPPIAPAPSGRYKATKIKYGFEQCSLMAAAGKALYLLSSRRGRSAADQHKTPMLWEVDPAKDKPSLLLPCPAQFNQAQSICGANERLYLITGSAFGLSGDGAVWEYNVNTKTARILPSTPKLPYGVLIAANPTTLFTLCGSYGVKGNHSPTTPCGCGTVFSISLEQKGQTRPLPLDVYNLDSAQAMVAVGHSYHTRLYIVFGNALGLSGEGRLVEYTVVSGVRRVIVSNALRGAVLLTPLSANRLLAIDSDAAIVYEIDINAVTPDTSEDQPQVATCIKARTLAEGSMLYSQALAVLHGRIFVVHGATRYTFAARLGIDTIPDEDDSTHASIARPSSVGLGGGIGNPGGGPPIDTTDFGLWEYALVKKTECGRGEKVPCLSFEDYCTIQGVFSKYGAEQLTAEQMKAACHQVQVCLQEGLGLCSSESGWAK